MSGNSLAKMMSKGRETASTDRTRPAPAPAPVLGEAEEKREKLGTRMLPSLQLLLGRHALELKAQTGKRGSVEVLLEALVQEYRDDPELQERVLARLKQG